MDSIRRESPLAPDLTLLMERHTAAMHAETPPESIHMLDASALDVPEIAFFVMRAADGRAVGMGTFAPEDWEEHLTIEIAAVNELSALSSLAAETIAYNEGLNGEILRGDQPLCFVFEKFARHYGLEVGDTAQFTLYYIQYPSFYEGKIAINPLGVYDLTVAGIIWPSAWDTGATPQNVILPVAWVRRAYAGSGIVFSPTSASFTVADPLQLNAFKSAMHTFGLLETDPTAAPSYVGSALKVHDKVFINSVNLLEENLSQLRFFLPVILVILVFTGYLTSYLLMRNRRREVAVMRSLGTGMRACLRIFTLENATLALAGALLGTLPAALLIPSADAAVLCLAAGVFCVCDLLGTVIALYGLSRFSVMDALCRTD